MAVDPHCFDAKNVHPPWQNSRYAPGRPLIPIPHLFLKIIVITIFSSREFVNYNNNARNSINVTKTLATKHQKNFASRYPFLNKTCSQIDHMLGI
jgi:hypothetical protein